MKPISVSYLTILVERLNVQDGKLEQLQEQMMGLEMMLKECVTLLRVARCGRRARK